VATGGLLKARGSLSVLRIDRASSVTGTPYSVPVERAARRPGFSWGAVGICDTDRNLCLSVHSAPVLVAVPRRVSFRPAAEIISGTWHSGAPWLTVWHLSSVLINCALLKMYGTMPRDLCPLQVASGRFHLRADDFA
jgi:hypothetical protein